MARKLGPPFALAVLLTAVGCHDLPTGAPPTDADPAPPAASRRVLGLLEVRFNAVGPGEVRPSFHMYRPVTARPGGPSFVLTPTEEGSVGSIVLEILPGAGSFTHGTRGTADGYRYVFASARVRNAGVNVAGDTVAYTTNRPNLTVVATAVPSGGGIAGTPFSNLNKFDGTAAASSIASGIRPTGAVRQTLTGGITTHSADVLQVFTESEVAALTGYDAFPYGFVVKHRTLANTRTLAANPAADQYDGILTLGLKIPLQVNPVDDVYGFSMYFVVVDDSDTRVTQSVEEQADAASQAAFETRAATLLGTTGVNLLPGGSYTGLQPVRRLCAVRVAGTPTSPTDYLGGLGPSCPTITSVTPNSGVVGATVPVTITGTNFNTAPGQTTVSISGNGVTVSNVVVSSSTSLTADIAIAAPPGANPGTRLVTVTTANGTSPPLTFTVNL